MNYTEQAKEALKIAENIATQSTSTRSASNKCSVPISSSRNRNASVFPSPRIYSNLGLYSGWPDSPSTPLGEINSSITFSMFSSCTPLFALLGDVDCVAMRILLTLNMNPQKILRDILSVLGVDPKEYQEEVSAVSNKKKADIQNSMGWILHRKPQKGNWIL